MSSRRSVMFALLVALPLLALGWLGQRVLRDDRDALQLRVRRLLAAQLGEIDRTIAARMAQLERDLLQLTDVPGHDTNALRELTWRESWLGQLLLLAPDGTVLHPPLSGELDQGERDFLRRMTGLITDRTLVRQGTSEAPSPLTAEQHGWTTRFWDSGLNLVFWRRTGAGEVLVAEVDRVRLLAEVIAALPDTRAQSLREQPERNRIVLLDSNGQALYQWGAYEPAAAAEPLVRQPLSAPLGAWGLAYFAPASQMGSLSRTSELAMMAGLASLGIALAGLSLYLHREYARDMRDAQQRVDFVDQVSHELKTPLTNVCLYSELLAQRLDAGDPTAERYATVIVSESQRLRRLIANVLTFSSRRRAEHRLNRTAARIDDVIAGVLEGFGPALQAKGIEVRRSAAATATVMVDADVVGQIVGNLVSNVEKYAAAGRVLEIRSSQSADRSVIEIADRGQGIPREQRETIFEPFQRLHNELTEGVAGTGIGLSIARDLAELHGGSLELTDEETGACFRLELHTPAAAEEGANG